MKRSIFNILHIFALKPILFEKNEIFKRNCQNPLRVQFRIDESVNFHQTPYIDVFWRADYEYNSENCRLVNFHGETIKIMVVCCLFHLIGDDLDWEKLPIVCLSVWNHLISFFSKNNCFREKMSSTLKIDLFIRYNFCTKYFCPRSIFIDIKWKNFLKTFF